MFQQLRAWAKRPVRTTVPRLRLPWWALIRSSTKKDILTTLVESGVRIRATMATPGWTDIESVIQDWMERYHDMAGQLGQKIEEQNGQLVLAESDTPADDRKRLIACAQAQALRGLLAEIKQRADAANVLAKREERQAKQEVVSDALV